jgi:diacylglycerol kinase family enzyme
MTTPLIMKTLYGALRGDGVHPSSSVDVATDVDKVSLSFPAPFPYQLDGDYLGETTSLEIEHCPAALLLVRPTIDF